MKKNRKERLNRKLDKRKASRNERKVRGMAERLAELEVRVADLEKGKP